MPVIRVEKKKNFTVMCNYHLRDITISLKAKGLLSIMLSLPDSWDYSIRGLAKICKEGVECVGSTLKELERCGYMQRRQIHGKDGKITDTEYIIYEVPLINIAVDNSEPILYEPSQKSPYTENTDMDNTTPEKSAQLNTNKINTKELNNDLIKYLSINHSPDDKNTYVADESDNRSMDGYNETSSNLLNNSEIHTAEAQSMTDNEYIQKSGCAL